MRRLWMLFVLTLFTVASPQAEATDRIFSDIEESSPSGNYRVTAKSPQNEKPTGRVSFQSGFVYECTDTATKEVLWTRKQAMGEPEKLGDGSTDTYIPALEGSPSRLYVSDSGFTVIYTGWGELIVVGPKGKESGKIKVLEDCFTEDEYNMYVSDTTAGPMWEGRSHWYFVSAESKEYFIIRPWWGRHMIIEVTTGTIETQTESISKAAWRAEEEYVLSVLKTVVDGTARRCDCCGGSHEAVFAAYLSGVLKVHDALPALRMLESSTHSGRSTSGGFGEVPEGRIDPFSYSTYTTRQNVQLALRRLGEKPGAFPCTQFKTEHRDYNKRYPYVRKSLPGTRELNAEKVKKGMSPEEVIDLIDCPDYIPRREWQYDIDAETPYTLTIAWTKERRVEGVNVVRPALWQEGTVRDSED